MSQSPATPYPHPGKEAVRAWMERRARTRLPPPGPAEIRRELGWDRRRVPPHPLTPPALLLPAMLAELATTTMLAWCWFALCPGRPWLLPKKNERGIS
ncbi:hypothetical protein [Pseudoduganella armeniaca]|uniref:hypothetical protein n=1 Tax=Pseudoduganella armeniaca TaxID=2072590 RepID=UPI0011B21C61|nr:hypothetical protein [Pseudoduganella armeniaca]